MTLPLGLHKGADGKGDTALLVHGLRRPLSRICGTLQTLMPLQTCFLVEYKKRSRHDRDSALFDLFGKWEVSRLF